MSEEREDRDGRAGGDTMLQPLILRLTLSQTRSACISSCTHRSKHLGLSERGWIAVTNYPRMRPRDPTVTRQAPTHQVQGWTVGDNASSTGMDRLFDKIE